MRGRPAKPSILKKIEGNRNQVAKSEIKTDPVAKGRPRLPLHLTTEERKIWADVVGSLPDSLLALADEGALERYACAWTEYRKHQAVLRAKQQYVIPTKTGMRANPICMLRDRAAAEMHKAGEVLGLSPVSRARMATKTAVEADPMESLLGMDGNPAGVMAMGAPQ